MKIEFYRHSLEQSDIENVCNTLKSIFLTTGPVTLEFEKRFCEHTGIKHTVALNSCTAALHLALLALNIGPGDEVITTPMTFIATATAIMHTGATPVFVDVEPTTGLMNANLVEQAITPRTKAILPVHLYGTMVDMNELRTIADRHSLKIVEDCAHCIEGERDGIRPGQLGDAACYSFYATKNLTCGEGGALCTNDGCMAEKVNILKLHGMSKDAASRYSGKYKHWDMVLEGWKYNMSDILAALMVNQIVRLEGNLERREAISTLYDRGFNDQFGIEVPKIIGKSARHLYTIWVNADRRDSILHAFQDKGVGVAVNYRAIHILTFFRDKFGFHPNDFPVAHDIGRRTITLPLYPGLLDEEVENVIDVARKVCG